MPFGSIPNARREAAERARQVSRRRFILGGAAAATTLGLYSGFHARHEFEITHKIFPIHNLPDAFQNFRIVQMSDIHLEEYTEAWFLEEMVRQVNNLNPDLVLLTGDFISRGPREEQVAWKAAGLCAEVLTGLKAPQRFAILGNHDAAVGSHHVIQPLEAQGTPVLVDSFFPLERGYDRLFIAGSDDVTTNPDLNLSVPQEPRAPVILMVHEPDYVETVIQHPRFPLIDLMLSGHSHGGQVRLPGIGPLILPPLGKKYVQGHFQFDHLQLYVNRGIGTVGLPFRLNCPAELTHMTLIRA